MVFSGNWQIQCTMNTNSTKTSFLFYSFSTVLWLTNDMIHYISGSKETTEGLSGFYPSWSGVTGRHRPWDLTGERTRYALITDDRRDAGINGHFEPGTQTASRLQGSQEKNKVVATALLHFWISERGTMPGPRNGGAPKTDSSGYPSSPTTVSSTRAEGASSIQQMFTEGLTSAR